MENKPNKSKIKITAIIAGIVIFSVIFPQMALAASFLGLDTLFSNVAIDLLTRLVNFIFSLLGFLVRAGAAFFEGMLSIGFKNQLEIVKTGWDVTRDFANMFFILFMVIIAFATILRFEEYGVKKLLPKVILIALLINFSYVICAVIIDFSNISANFFINGIERDLGGKGKIASTFTDSLSLTKVYFGTDCEKERDEQLEICNGMIDPIQKEGCKALTEMDFEKCMKALGLPTKPPSTWSAVLSLLISATIGSLVLLIAAFTLFAGGILLIIRILFLWFLVMIVPLVFICYIMPGLRKNWQTWWSHFLRWCFFAPAYAFFIWLAIRISVENRNKQLAAGVESTFSQFVDAGPGANPFVSNPGQQLISYGFIIALLIGGLIAASKMGIYGADTAMKIGQKWGRGAGAWVKSKTTRYPKEIGSALAGEAVKSMGRGFQRIPGFRAFGERMEARGKIIAAKPLKAPEIKKAEEMFKQMTPEQLAHQIKTQISGGMTYAAAKVAHERGDFLKNKDKAAADIAAKTFRAYGDIKTAEDIEKSRPDIIEDDKKQYDTLKEMKDKGQLDKLSAIALEDERVVSKLTMLGVDLEKLRNTSIQHADNLKATLTRITNPVNQANMIARGINPLAKETQHAYAAQTGDPTRMTPTQRAFFARDAGPEGLKRTTSLPTDPTDRANMVNAIPATKLKSIIDKMEKDNVAKDIIRAIKANPAHPAYQMVIRDRYLNNLA